MRIASKFFNPEQVLYVPARHLARLLVETGVKLGGHKFPVSVAIGYHSRQCGQRWWGIRVGKWRLAYRTRGDASPTLATFSDGGWWFPWHLERTCAGFWL